MIFRLSRELRQVEMAVQATPAADLVMVHPQGVFRHPEAAFHHPATEGHSQQPPQCDAPLAGHAVGHEVLHFKQEVRVANLDGTDDTLLGTNMNDLTGGIAVFSSILEPCTLIIWLLLGAVGLVMAWRRRKTA